MRGLLLWLLLAIAASGCPEHEPDYRWPGERALNRLCNVYGICI
jgi:hypothetical protein